MSNKGIRKYKLLAPIVVLFPIVMAVYFFNKKQPAQKHTKDEVPISQNTSVQKEKSPSAEYPPVISVNTWSVTGERNITLLATEQSRQSMNAYSATHSHLEDKKQDKIGQFLATVRKKHPDAVALYAAVYESSNGSIILRVPDDVDKSFVLYLSSYDSVRWQVYGSDGFAKNVVGVVYGSQHSGSLVKGIPEKLTFYDKEFRGSHDSDDDCHCVYKTFFCEGSNVFEDINELQKKYSIPIIDYSVDYSTNYMKFTHYMNPLDFSSLAQKSIETRRKEKESCKKGPGGRALQLPGSKDYSRIVFHDEDNNAFPVETRPPKLSSMRFDNHLTMFPLAASTWGDYLNPENKVPNSGYMAYYMNAANSKKVVHKRNVFVMKEKHSYDKFLGIPSQNFNVFWVGLLTVPKSRFYSVNVDKSWASVRVIIDKRIIFEDGTEGDNTKVFIPKGNHIVEVEFANAWHTSEVRVSVDPL